MSSRPSFSSSCVIQVCVWVSGIFLRSSSRVFPCAWTAWELIDDLRCFCTALETSDSTIWFSASKSLELLLDSRQSFGSTMSSSTLMTFCLSCLASALIACAHYENYKCGWFQIGKCPWQLCLPTQKRDVCSAVTGWCQHHFQCIVKHATQRSMLHWTGSCFQQWISGPIAGFTENA